MNNREAAKTIETAKRFAYDKKFEEAFDAGIKALGQTEWIPVKSEDDYPETCEEVFVTYNDGKVGTNSVFVGYAKGDCIKAWNRGGNVIAWRPMPEPYKEGIE